MEKAIFLDRDGTINVDKGYVYRSKDFEFIEGVPEAIRTMKQLGYLVIVLTNQSGVARGYFREEDVLELHCYINEKLNDMGAAIDGFYFCPHHPEGTIAEYCRRCMCRKPAVGLLQQALRDFSVNLGESWVVGDRERDLFLGYEASMGRVLLTMNEDKKAAHGKYLVRKSLWEFVQMDLA